MTQYDRSQYPKCTVPAAEVARVKGLGFLRDKRTADRFHCRVVTGGGKLNAEELQALADAATKFGTGEVVLTSRMNVEVQGIPFESIEPFTAFLAQYGLEPGGTGPRVRPVVSCKGTSCVFGLIDTYGLAEKIHHLYYKGYHGVKLPHKFKIGVGGCPNNCVKPDLNDVGIIGQWVPVLSAEKCIGCGACVKACPVNACEIENGKYVRAENVCNSCGRCVRACSVGALAYEHGYRVTLGGRWGKKVARGVALSHLFTSEEEVLAAIEKAILLFRDQGLAGERFADTIARIGVEKVEQLLLCDELLNRKEEILAKAL
ncbi:MAG: 4Fe-4S binding protein [Clostridia bacterium]|nr:4Fe-4S binding protein [Clostridia bacterium]